MAVASEIGGIAPVPESYQERVATLSVRQLMWLRFKRNRLAVVGGVFLIIMYLLAIFAGFVAPYGVRTTHDRYPTASPNGLHFVDSEGTFHLRPFVYGFKAEIDPETFRRTYTPLWNNLTG